jgi:hypothetical protein
MPIHPGMSRADYDALKRVGKSPAHYVHGFSGESDAMKLGTATHVAVLEPELFASTYVVYGKRRQSKEWDAFEAAQTAAGKTILTKAEHDEAVAMACAVRSHHVAQQYVSGGQSEVSITWDFEAPEQAGLPAFKFECKGRLDKLLHTAIVDLKSTRDASPEGFAKQCANLGIHAQAAYYSDGYAAATGERLPYVVVAVESSAPHVVTVFRVEGEALEIGRDEYQTLLGRLDQCRQTKQWGGYADGEVSLVLPRWKTKLTEAA